MKKLSMLLAFGLLTLPSAFGATCGSGVAYSLWLTPTFSCSIGDKTFSNFSYVPSGLNPIPATAVTVSTIGPSGSGATIVGPNIGLQFNAPWNAAGTGSSDAAIDFTVTVSSGPALISDLGLAQVSGVNPPGTASVSELICGTGPTCTPNVFSTLTFQTSASCPTPTSPGCQLTTTTTLTSNFGSINVVKDIASTGGGGNGFADLSQVQDTFSQTSVPEPVTMGLLGGGLALLGIARWRRAAKR